MRASTENAWGSCLPRVFDIRAVQERGGSASELTGSAESAGASKVLTRPGTEGGPQCKNKPTVSRAHFLPTHPGLGG